MQIPWRIILPVVGLLLFAGVSYRSARANDQLYGSPHRYYWWSSLRLDTDPLNEHPKPPEVCRWDPGHCANWEVSVAHLRPGWADRVLVVSAFPAFLGAFALVLAVGRKGVNEVLTFMFVMPTFLFAWYYFFGRLLERWLYRRKQARGEPLKLMQSG